MKRPKRLVTIAIVAALLVLALVLAGVVWRVGSVSGVVTAGGRPLAGATVRVKATKFETKSDAGGGFSLACFPPQSRVQVTAWAGGYYVGGDTAYPWKHDVAIDLQPYRTTDNTAYSWLPPKVEKRPFGQEMLARVGLPVAAKLSFSHLFLPLSARLPLGCADCHGSVIYQQYASNAHARGANNVIFRTVYNGVDTAGRRSPPTNYGFNRDYGRFPLRPDPSQPWYGPGFKLDFPDQAGNCANCHMPGEAIAAPNGTDVNKIATGAVQGIHCDLCHKAVNVRVNPATNVPEENMAGVLSMEFRRPEGEPQLFFGPFDDVDVGPDTYLPLQNESRLCAACHNASFWGTPVYQSYSEWLNSPYPKEGKTCQTCHMKPDGITDNFAPGRGGVVRDPQRIFTHNFPGAADVDLLRKTAKLEISGSRRGDTISAEVRVTNENAGHDIPTDHPMRNMILVVTAKDASGKLLESVGNQKVPDWGGAGSAFDDYAGLPGKGYAKVLEEVWTEVSPTVAYWRQTKIKEDTRIPARATDVTRYEFKATGDGAVTIEARLVFRRAFKDLVTVKQWDVSDIEMNHETITLK